MLQRGEIICKDHAAFKAKYQEKERKRKEDNDAMWAEIRRL